jgi:hypothetical protein
MFVFSSKAQSTNGSNYISTAVPFLTISPDSRASGMGDVGVATSPDINSMHWNLSKLAFLEKKAGVSVSYTPWLKEIAEGMSLSYISGFYALSDNQVLSGSLRYFNLGDVDIVDANGSSLRTSTPNEFAIDIGYTRRLQENFSMAVAFRYIRSNIIDNHSGSSVAVDISAFYTKAIDKDNIAFGLNISNIGSKMSYGSKTYYLPTNLKIGTSYTKNISKDSDISFSFDINKLLVDAGDETAGSNNGVISIGNESNKSLVSSIVSSFSDYSSLTYSFGTEYLLQKKFAVRLGYFTESKDAGNRNYITTGLGVNYNKIDFDIAYLVAMDSNNPLRNTLRFTLGYIF